MKKILLSACALSLLLNVSAQNNTAEQPKDEGFVFTTIKELPITSVKNQNRSSTCWCFSGLSFFEAELLRMGKGEYDFAEMFVVHHTMLDRASNYVRLHGDNSFLPGGVSADVLYCIRHYGLVPQQAMPGILYGDSLPVHNELDAVAGAYVNAIAKGRYSKLTPVWRNGLSGIYDAYLGQCPSEFTYNGKKYTPMEFVKSTGLDKEEYVSITSFTHHPFYTDFPVEMQDNWRLTPSYNLPMDEMMQVIDYAINNGYPIAWSADVSEPGFTRNGIGVMPDADKGAELTGSDMARWTGLSREDKRKELTSHPLPQMNITQELRQKGFDNWETTDDHGLVIYGIAKDQNGDLYYMCKNSWGTNNKYKGTWYISKPYVEYKTINFMINKKALPKEIAKKLGLK